MTRNNLFSQAQHGFIKGRSCVTQLLEFLEEITEAVYNGDEVDIIYLDFCKAFDKVPHKRLLKKIEGYGIKGQILKWIESFFVEPETKSHDKWILLRMATSNKWHSSGKCTRTNLVNNLY